MIHLALFTILKSQYSGGVWLKALKEDKLVLIEAENAEEAADEEENEGAFVGTIMRPSEGDGDFDIEASVLPSK